MSIDPIRTDSKRKMRVISGTVAEIEDQFAALQDEYVIFQWRWDVVDGHHLLGLVLLRAADVEKAMRMQALMAGGPGQVRPQ